MMHILTTTMNDNNDDDDALLTAAVPVIVDDEAAYYPLPPPLSTNIDEAPQFLLLLPRGGGYGITRSCPPTPSKVYASGTESPPPSFGGQTRC